MNTIGSLLIGLAILLAVWQLVRIERQRGHRGGPPRSGQAAERHWMTKLMDITRGNTGAIERSVTAKRRRFPQATRAELLERVYDDYRRDR